MFHNRCCKYNYCMDMMSLMVVKVKVDSADMVGNLEMIVPVDSSDMDSSDMVGNLEMEVEEDFEEVC